MCVVSNDARLDENLDMASVFFKELFQNNVAPRVMSGLIALSVFGNLVVTSFTLSRGSKLKLLRRSLDHLLTVAFLTAM